MIKQIENVAMEALSANQLENVTNSAYALDPEFTPSYSVMGVELPSLAGYQLRVIGSMIALTTVGYNASDDKIRGATQTALRVLMVKMRNQAMRWLQEHPET